MSDYRIITTEKTSPIPEASEPIKERTFLQNFIRSVIAVVFIFAMLYISGLHQYVQFQQTERDTAVGTYESLIKKEAVSIPVTVFVLQEDEGERVNDSPRRLVSQAGTILGLASINLDPITVETIFVADQETVGTQLIYDPESLRRLLPELSDDRLYTVVTPSLGGVNGIAFGGTQIVAVAEYTTSFDFRVLAHEFGHALGLGHVSDKSNLMNSGGIDTELTQQQAQEIYESAQAFSQSGA